MTEKVQNDREGRSEGYTHCHHRRSRFSVTIDEAAGGVKDLEHRVRHISEGVAAYLIMSSG